MYQLVSRIQDGLGELRNLLETHITGQGSAAIEKCGESALNVRQTTTRLSSTYCNIIPPNLRDPK